MGIAKLCCLLPRKCQDFPACPCLPGPHKVSSALLEAGIASAPALCGWVTGLSLGGCQEEHLGPAFSDLLPWSTRSMAYICSMYLFVYSYHSTGEIAHYRDVDNKSPGLGGKLVSWCAGPLCLSLPQMNFVATIFAPDRAATWQLSKALQMLWA